MNAQNFAWLGTPIDARPLFTPEHAALMSTLRKLEPDDWGREAVPGWTIRDLTAHILGDCYGRLRGRDGHQGGSAIAPGETLEMFIHRSNQEWVDALSRVSPAALTDTLDLIGEQVARLFEAADPEAPAAVGVSWAGADPAPAWLDIARELTEYWTHRQQIRAAIGQEPDPLFLPTVLDTFMRALPHTLREFDAPPGTQVRIRVDGQIWTATATPERWSLEPNTGELTAAVHLDPQTAWLLCTRGIQPEEALAHVRIDGDRELAEAACQIVSIIY